MAAPAWSCCGPGSSARPDGFACNTPTGAAMAIVTRSAGEPALRTLKLPYVPNAPGRFSPNGSLLATRQPAGHFGVFDLTQGKEVLRVQTRPAAGGPVGFTSSGQPLAFSPDGG